MTNRKTTNIAVSTHNKLLALARKKDTNFNNLLRSYLQERFLYRLSVSEFKDKFVLKGGFMLVSIDIPAARPTMDIDFMAQHMSNDTANLMNAFKAIAAIKPEVDDAITFDASSITSESIMNEGDYKGTRIKLKAKMGSSITPMTFDIGFGDVITPDVRMSALPTLLDSPAPILAMYPLETVIAEKFEAMLKLSHINGRMKDFYDVYSILNKFDLNPSTLKKAINNTFTNRGTVLPKQLNIFTHEFYENKQAQWINFLKSNELTGSVPNKFGVVVNFIKQKLEEIIISST